MRGYPLKKENQEPASESANTDAGTDPTLADGIPSSVADVGSLAHSLASEMSAPQPHAIAQANAEREANADKDKSGAAFDPAIHIAGPEGRGVKNAKGNWSAKRGRKPGASANPAGKPKLVLPGSGATPTATDTKAAAARAGGATAANLLIMLSVGLGGSEWLPRKEPEIPYDEKAALEGAFGDYFASKGWEDLPPGWALVAACGMYALPRFSMPKTQERAKTLKSWFFDKIAAWKLKKAKRAFQTREERNRESAIERADRESREQFEKERKGAL